MNFVSSDFNLGPSRFSTLLRYRRVDMFYHGDLQSGIALALSESKLVCCFVRSKPWCPIQWHKLTCPREQDESEESDLWETEFLEDSEVSNYSSCAEAGFNVCPQVSSRLSSKTVLLRMIAGSREAGYLSAYFHVPTVPTLLILQ